MRYLLLFIAFLPISMAKLQSQPLYFPPATGTWQTQNFSDLGWCQDDIDSLYAYLQVNNSKGFILLNQGKIVLETYFGTFTKDSLWYWASAGKTLTAMLVGIAQQEGHLSLSDSSSQYLGSGWTSAPANKEGLITIRHQLALDAGLNDGLSNPDCTLDTCLQYLTDPGTRWAYHNAVYTLLDSVLLNATGQNANALFQSRIRPTTGINGLYLMLGYNNVFFSTLRSMARYGLLLQNRGNWNGTPVLSDTAFFGQMTRPSQLLNRSYGYLTWLNGQSSFMLPTSQLVFPGPLFPDAPSTMFAALGKDGQIISVAANQGLVWVRMGESPNSGSATVTPIFANEIWKYINRLPCSSGLSDELHPDGLVWPNPGSKLIRYRGAETPLEWKVYDALGRLRLEHGPGNELETTELEPHVYWIEIQLPNRPPKRTTWVKESN